MASCTYDEGYECIFAREGLSLTEDFYISVSETFSAQNGSFVCRNGGPALEQFPCFYSSNSVKPEVKCGMTEIDNNLAGIIGAVCGFLIILQLIFIGFLLFKNRKLRKDRKELRLSTEKSEEAKKEAEKRNLIEREDVQICQQGKNSLLSAKKSKSSNGEPGEAKYCSDNNRVSRIG